VAVSAAAAADENIRFSLGRLRSRRIAAGNVEAVGLPGKLRTLLAV